MQTSGLEFAAVTSNSFSNSFLTWRAASYHGHKVQGSFAD